MSKTRKSGTPMEKLIKRYETRKANLIKKRDGIEGEYQREWNIIDSELGDIGEILKKLKA